MSDWINTNFTYRIDVSDAATTATQSFKLRAGVCRDFAQVLIAMARAVGIPARIVSAYAPNVSPQDFHAVAEVYLDNRWHLIDPTRMARASEIVRIGVGRDAADVSFLTSYGELSMKKQTVEVSRVVMQD
jgi:transglutaminase-like putative cysteine protease